MMNSMTCEQPEDRAKRDDDKKDAPCDVRAVVDAYRDELISKDEARALMGYRDDDKKDDEPKDDADTTDRDDDEGDDEGDEE
jgi:hypothetical protein